MMNVSEPEIVHVRKRVAVKVWTAPEWLEWLDKFAKFENMTLPGVTAAALVDLALAHGVQPCDSIVEQIRPAVQFYGVMITRGHYSFYYWDSARVWIKSLARTLNEGVGSLIERALMEYAESRGYPAPPPRTRVRRCIPRI